MKLRSLVRNLLEAGPMDPCSISHAVWHQDSVHIPWYNLVWMPIFYYLDCCRSLLNCFPDVCLLTVFFDQSSSSDSFKMSSNQIMTLLCTELHSLYISLRKSINFLAMAYKDLMHSGIPLFLLFGILVSYCSHYFSYTDTLNIPVIFCFWAFTRSCPSA